MIGRASARPKLSEPTGFGSAERADLAIAVAALQAAENSAQRLQNGVNELEERRLAARSARWAADAALTEAKENAPRHLAASVMGTVSKSEPPPQTVKEAQAAFDAAVLAEKDATAALEMLRPQLAGEMQTPRYARERCLVAARTVIRSEAQAVAVANFNETMRLRKELEDRTTLHRWYVRNELFSRIASIGGMFGEAEDPAVRLVDRNAPLELLDLSASPVCAPWHAALEALMQDANAPLPGDAQ